MSACGVMQQSLSVVINLIDEIQELLTVEISDSGILIGEFLMQGGGKLGQRSLNFFSQELHVDAMIVDLSSVIY